MEKNSWIGVGAAIFCLTFAFLTQGNGQQATGESLKLETERIHDEAMRDLAAMNRVGRTLKKALPALDSLAPRRTAIRKVLGQMDRAEDDMYNWMKAYSPPTDPNTDTAKKYLEDQKRKIEQNHRDIRAAWEAGKLLVMPKD